MFLQELQPSASTLKAMARPLAQPCGRTTHAQPKTATATVTGSCIRAARCGTRSLACVSTLVYVTFTRAVRCCSMYSFANTCKEFEQNVLCHNTGTAIQLHDHYGVRILLPPFYISSSKLDICSEFEYCHRKQSITLHRRHQSLHRLRRVRSLRSARVPQEVLQRRCRFVTRRKAWQNVPLHWLRI